MKRCILVWIMALCLGNALAFAAPISISFDTIADFEGIPGGSTNAIPSGEPDNDVGLTLSGQVGPWNSLVVGNGNFRDTYNVARSITVGAVTFNLNPSGLDSYQSFSRAVDPLRGTVIFVEGPGGI